MLIRLKMSALKETQPYEYLMRFGLGGLVTVMAGVVADHFGPEIGGLFLAFPAIFCASATLIEKHDRKRKARKNLEGAKRGRGAAALDAAGAAWGSLALVIFAWIVWSLAERGAALALGFAGVAWLIGAVGLWFLRRALHPR